MIHADQDVSDREHTVVVTFDGDAADPLRLTPEQALTAAEGLAGSTDIGAREFADELRRAADPPLACASCRDRNASHGDWCSVCVPDDLDRPVRL